MTDQNLKELIEILKYITSLALETSQKVAAAESVLRTHSEIDREYRSSLEKIKTGDDGVRLAIRLEALETGLFGSSLK